VQNETTNKLLNLYKKLSKNGIYSIEAQKSDFFRDLVGKPFPVCSFIAHEK
jgi:hypothetical protein